MIKDWLLSGTKESPERLGMLLVDAMPASLKNFFTEA
jgi:hypothetical protein